MISPRRLNPRLAGMTKSATLAISERAQELSAAGKDVFRLGIGQSPFPVPPTVVNALRRHAHQKAYLPVEGLPELRAAIAGYFNRSIGIDAHEQRIVVGPGTKELMFLLQLACDCELLLPAPSWVSYAPQAALNNRSVRWLPTSSDDDFRVSADAIEAACADDPGRSRLLILNYPNNPTGHSYGTDELEEIATVARRHDILVLSDEIYSGLTFAGNHASIAGFYPEGTIVSDGLSKWCGAGGWRVGAFAFPAELDWLRNAVAAGASETYSAVSAPIQYASIVAFDGGEELDNYLARSRRLLQALMTWIASRLRDAGASVGKPCGAFYLLPRFDDACARFVREGRPATAAELCVRVLDETSVALLPGDEFGMPADTLFARLAAVDFDGEAALAAMDRLGPDEIPDAAFLEDHCTRTITAIKRVCDWLDD
ncbi:MAG: pyridoxal phosphate-dependent aminotransferase [Gammaproteobacteria bacterium]